jgi:hypothetical protein
MAQLESPSEWKMGLTEPSPGAHTPEGLYIASNIVRDCWEVPVMVLNATHFKQLMKGSPWHTVSQLHW